MPRLGVGMRMRPVFWACTIKAGGPGQETSWFSCVWRWTSVLHPVSSMQGKELMAPKIWFWVRIQTFSDSKGAQDYAD